MPAPRGYVPVVTALDQLDPLIQDRALASALRDQADEDVHCRNADLLASLEAAGQERIQTHGGHIVQIVRPRPRLVVSADKLMKHGVAIDIIEACTEPRPVSPFVRVDAPGGTDRATVEEPTDVRPGRVQ